jgi:hypothetical protein
MPESCEKNRTVKLLFSLYFTFSDVIHNIFLDVSWNNKAEHFRLL